MFGVFFVLFYPDLFKYTYFFFFSKFTSLFYQIFGDCFTFWIRIRDTLLLFWRAILQWLVSTTGVWTLSRYIHEGVRRTYPRQAGGVSAHRCFMVFTPVSGLKGRP